VILVEKIHPNIIKSLSQKISENLIFVFDEFEKNYLLPDEYGEYEERDVLKQSDLLSLLDGIYNKKDVFLFTANYIEKIDKLFFTRPGRIYFVFKFYKVDESIIKELFSDPEDRKFLDILNSNELLNMDLLMYIKNERSLGIEMDEILNDIGFDRDSLVVSSYEVEKMIISYEGKEYEAEIKRITREISIGDWRINVEFLDEENDFVDITFASRNSKVRKINDKYELATRHGKLILKL